MRRNLLSSAIRFVVLSGTFFCSLAARADCDPKFGDNLYEWVVGDARRQAIALAEADFIARANNGRVVGYDDVRAEQERISTYFDTYTSELPVPSTAAATLSLRDAVAMQEHALRSLDALVGKGFSLVSTRQRLESMSSAPGRDRFVSIGLHHVGRTTMLESIVALGDERAKTLAATYSISVNVTVDGGGKVQEGGLGLSGNEEVQGMDAAAIALMNSPEYYSKMVGFAYVFVRLAIWGNEQVECRKKIEKQRTRSLEATTLLASTLPTVDETFSLYAKSEVAAIARFAAVQEGFLANQEILEKRWRELMSINLARANVASKLLTVEKLDLIRNARKVNGDLASVVNEVALATLTREVQAVQADAIQREVDLQFLCRNLSGLRAAEDLLDRRREASAELDESTKIAAFAPLTSVLNRVSVRLKRGVPRATALLNGKLGMECNDAGSKQRGGIRRSSYPPISPDLPMVAKASPVRSSIYLPDIQRSPPFLPKRLIGHKVPVIFSPGQTRAGLSAAFCTIYKSGPTYSCRDTGADSQNRFGRDFTDDGRPSFEDVSRGRRDGGFAQDSRRLEADISSAKTNIDARISDLRKRQSEIDRATVDWLTVNQGGLAGLASQQAGTMSVTERLREELVANYEQVLLAAGDRLTVVGVDSSDLRGLGEIISRSAAVDVRLSTLPADSVMPDGPKISGFKQEERAFGGSRRLVDRRLIREERKAALLTGKPLERHKEVLQLARRFAAQKTIRGDEIAEALIEDAASIRFASAGSLSTASSTVIDRNGAISRRSDAVEQTSTESLVEHARTFEARALSLQRQQRFARQALEGNVEGQGSRVAALQLSEDLSSVAGTSFFAGDVRTAEGLQIAAQIILDLVTSWTPGISLGRDVYEAASGRDLITGRQLKTWEQTAAVLGVVSFGIVSKGPKLLHAIKQIGKAGEALARAEHIAKTAHAIDHLGVKQSLHALEQIERRGIDIDRVNDTIDRGSKFWDVVERKVIAAETGIASGAERVVAAVDIDTSVVTTVYHEVRSDTQLAKVLTADTARARYIPLPYE